MKFRHWKILFIISVVGFVLLMIGTVLLWQLNNMMVGNVFYITAGSTFTYKTYWQWLLIMVKSEWSLWMLVDLAVMVVSRVGMEKTRPPRAESDN